MIGLSRNRRSQSPKYAVVNSDNKSFYFGHFKIGAGEYTKQDEGWVFSMAAITDSILKLISSNPKKDREALISINIKDRNRLALKNNFDNAPLREWYINKRDKDLYDLIRYFLDLSADKFIKKDIPVFKKTIGIAALFDVLFFILKNNTATDVDEINGVISEFFYKICNAETFRNNFFTVSSKGRGRIKNTLLISSGIPGYYPTRLSEPDEEEIKSLLSK